MKVNRKKFFKTAAISLIGISIFKKIPFRNLGNDVKTDGKKIKVKLNQSAVSRKFKERSNA